MHTAYYLAQCIFLYNLLNTVVACFNGIENMFNYTQRQIWSSLNSHTHNRTLQWIQWKISKYTLS